MTPEACDREVTEMGKRRLGRPYRATRRLLLGAAVVVGVSAATLGLAWADASRTGSSSGTAVAKRSIPPTIRAHKMTIAAVKHRTARVKLLGEKGFRVRRIAPWSLRLRTKGPNLSSGWRRHERFKLLGDVNDDGFADARATFRISLKKRVAAGHSHVEVIGILGARRHRGHHHRALRAAASTSSGTGAWTSFSASTPLVVSDGVTDYCTVGSSGYYVRCTFTLSFDDYKGGLDTDELVEDLNDDLSDAGYDYEITSSDSVQVELWGGAGAEGHDPSACKSGLGGSGGGRGYAQSAQSVAALEDLGDGNLYVYVGQDGPDSQMGGSSSMLLGQSILDVTDVQDPATETFLGIAGGGGGGGETDTSDHFPCQDSVGTCYYNGHSGGNGGVAIATSAASVAGAGQDGHDGKDGKGGSDSTATADDGGQPGVGGFSVDYDTGTDNGWAGSSITLDDWSHGSGGDSGKDGGGGGGFGGGGHGNKDGDNYSGGGGGGSWALENSVASDSTYQVGQDGYDEPGVILTFETSPTS